MTKKKKTNLANRFNKIIKHYQLFLIIVAICALLVVGYYLYNPSIVKSSQEIKEDASQALAQEDYQQAQKSYQVLADREPDNYAYNYNLAKTYHYQKDYQQAFQVYQQAYNLNQNRSEILNLMANCQREMGDNQKAEELYREAISKSPNLPTYYQNLSAMLYGDGNKKEAKKVLSQGLKFNPDSKNLKNMQKRIQ